MSLSLTSPIIFVILIIIVFYLWKRYEEKQFFAYSSSPLYTKKMFEKYLLGERILIKEEIGKIDKPIMWIHVPYEYNARNWESFGSRSSFDLNQPYLYLTLKSIIDHCQDDFQIILVDDASFEKVLDDCKVNVRRLTCMQRNVCMLQLIEKYGGIILPISFVCFRNLLPMFLEGTKDDLPFVAEKVNHQANLRPEEAVIPDVCLVGTSKKKDPEISELISFMRKTEKSDMFTLASKFEGSLPNYLQSRIFSKKINLISSQSVGTKTKEGKIVLIENLLSHGSVHFSKDAFGIWIPSREILQRTNFQWFARMSQSQIVHSDFVLAKYLIVANDPNSFFSSPLMHFFSSFFMKEGMENINVFNDTESPSCSSNSIISSPKQNKRRKEKRYRRFQNVFEDWKGWWKTPLLPDGMYWTKPMYLGQDVPKSTYVK